MTKLHKIEFYLVEWNDELDSEDIMNYLENCFEDHGFVKGLSLKSKDIGDWYDDYKFNLISTLLEEYKKEFE